MIEFEALGERRRHQIDAGVKDLDVFAEKVISNALPLEELAYAGDCRIRHDDSDRALVVECRGVGRSQRRPRLRLVAQAQSPRCRRTECGG